MTIVANVLMETSLRVCILAAAGWLAAACLRRRSAAARHAVWTITLAGMLLMPLLNIVLPRFRLPLLPQAHVAAVPAPTVVVTTAPISAGASVQASPQRRPLSSSDFVLLAYLAGASVFAMRFGLAMRQRAKLIAGATSIPRNEVWIPATAGVRLLESADLAVPCTAGWRRPKILFPLRWREWDRAKFDAVLAHELAHVSRGDTIIAMFAALNKAMFWFHPVAWRLETELAAAAEEASDDAAVAIVGNRDTYAEALLHIASALCGRPNRVAWSEAAMASSSKVGARIRRLLSDSYSVPAPVSAPLRTVFAVACAVAVLVISSFSVERKAVAQGITQFSSGLPRLDPSITPEVARDLEEQLRRYPKDLITRSRLLAYYHAKRMSQEWLAHISWLIENDPGNTWFTWRSLERHPSLAPLWIRAADRNPSDPGVLENAGHFFQALGEPLRAEEYFLRARQLKPDNDRYAGLLINLYGSAIVGFERQSPHFPQQSPAYEAFAQRAKADLLGSNDAHVVGGVGRYIAVYMRQPLEQTTWKDRDIATRLLQRAAQLTPSDDRWRTELAQVKNPPVADRLINAGPLKPVQLVPPMYPPLAQAARVEGKVVFALLIAEDGSVEEAVLTAGHPLLVPAAKEAVVQWKFDPPKLNGQPFKARTTAEVPFELSGAPSRPGAPVAYNPFPLPLLMETAIPQLIAGSKEGTMLIRFEVDATGAPTNIGIKHPEEVTPAARQIAENVKKLRYAPAAAQPYEVRITLKWTGTGGIMIDATHRPVE